DHLCSPMGALHGTSAPSCWCHLRRGHMARRAAAGRPHVAAAYVSGSWWWTAPVKRRHGVREAIASWRGVTMTATHNLIPPPATILVIDIGGSKVKMLATGETSLRKFQSGKRLTPAWPVKRLSQMVAGYVPRGLCVDNSGRTRPRGEGVRAQ